MTKQELRKIVDELFEEHGGLEGAIEILKRVAEQDVEVAANQAGYHPHETPGVLRSGERVQKPRFILSTTEGGELEKPPVLRKGREN